MISGILLALRPSEPRICDSDDDTIQSGPLASVPGSDESVQSSPWLASSIRKQQKRYERVNKQGAVQLLRLWRRRTYVQKLSYQRKKVNYSYSKKSLDASKAFTNFPVWFRTELHEFVFVTVLYKSVRISCFGPIQIFTSLFVSLQCREFSSSSWKVVPPRRISKNMFVGVASRLICYPI